MDADVIIVGLGTAGAAVAALCAEAGLRVIGLERRPLAEAGAHWMNGVPRWTVSQSIGVGDETVSGPVPFHLLAGWGPHRVTVSSVDELDMGKLVRRLQQRAVTAGAILHEQVKVVELGEAIQTSAGPLRARTYVDASGYTGARLLGQPRRQPSALCTACQYSYEPADLGAARAFFAEHGARPGEVLCFSGVEGGYSIVNVRIQHGELHLLVGTIPGPEARSAAVVAEQFVGSHPFFGRRLRGGARVIPLGLPLDVIGSGSVAAIGDSAGQVHAAHGSGIGQQLLAAKLLADTLAAGGCPADYNLAWQRRYGGVLAGADVFRRFSQQLRPHEVEALIRRKILSPPLMGDALLQRPTRPPPRALIRALRGLARERGLARTLLPVLARMQALETVYRGYPATPRRRAHWIRLRDRVAA